MRSTWSPNGLTLPSKEGSCSVTRDTSSLGRSVVLATAVRDVVPLLSRDSWRGIISSWWTLGRCCICEGHEIFLDLGDGERRAGWDCDIFLLINRGLVAWFIDSAESFLSDGEKGSLRELDPSGCVVARLIISADLELRLTEVFGLSCRELWLDVFLKRWLVISSLVWGVSVTEILRRGTDRVLVEDEEWSDEFDNCAVIGRFRADDTFLVRVPFVWLLVVPAKPFCVSWLRLSASTKEKSTCWIMMRKSAPVYFGSHPH